MRHFKPVRLHCLTNCTVGSNVIDFKVPSHWFKCTVRADKRFNLFGVWKCWRWFQFPRSVWYSQHMQTWTITNTTTSAHTKATLLDHARVTNPYLRNSYYQFKPVYCYAVDQSISTIEVQVTDTVLKIIVLKLTYVYTYNNKF